MRVDRLDLLHMNRVLDSRDAELVRKLTPDDTGWLDFVPVQSTKVGTWDSGTVLTARWRRNGVTLTIQCELSLTSLSNANTYLAVRIPNNHIAIARNVGSASVLDASVLYPCVAYSESGASEVRIRTLNDVASFGPTSSDVYVAFAIDIEVLK